MEDKDYAHEDTNSEAEEQLNPFHLLKEKQEQLDKMEPLQFHIPSMIKALQAEIPLMPADIEVKQEMPPPFKPKFKDVEKIIIGQQPPP